MQKIDYNDALGQSLKYFNGNKLAATVFLGKYALRDKDKNLYEATPEQMHRRLAREFARIEKKYPNPLTEEEIFCYLDQFSCVIPQGSPMAGIGNPFQVMSLSNCFVVESPYDSYAGICKTDQELAQIMKRRGGVGIDISKIRPKNMPTANAAQTTDGIGIFMTRFSNTCNEVAQNGRRGALMITISVHHPEIRTFIHIKEDLKKVTGANISIRLSNEFMNAVRNKEKVELRFPVDSKNPQVSELVDAESLWKEIVGAAHASAEPGLLFWDNIMETCPANAYPEFITISTNPCFSGDTLIAVADGRNAVSIKQLAEEGKDVPVYSVDPKTGIVEIKMGRNPRVTGYGKKLLRVLLDNGSYFDVTPDHKFMLRDGNAIEARFLCSGDSLSPFAKELSEVKKGGEKYYRIRCDSRNSQKTKTFEHRLIAKFNQPKKWTDTYNFAKKNGWINSGGLVVHHKDYNGLNNRPDNLEIMTFQEHQKFHAQLDNVGENNGHYYDVANFEIKTHAIELTKKLNRRFTNDEWCDYAQINNLPKTFSEWRQINFFKSPVHLAKACALELGIENGNLDARVVKNFISMLNQGYAAEIIENKVVVKKTCEICSTLFAVEYNKREMAFCSHECSLLYINRNKEIAIKRNFGIDKFAKEKTNKNRQNQACVFSAMKFSLKREPSQKEWQEACAAQKIPFRIGKTQKYGFKNWKEVKEAGSNYNHKVVSVAELNGEHTVYNITVDDNHTVSIVNEFKDKDTNQLWYGGINVFQCGEITLSAYDSCRLLLVNALSVLRNAFTDQAKVDWQVFRKVVSVAQRLMDDIVDLELECVEKIIAKVQADPEPDDVKYYELNLWEKIRKACINGRRTGLGMTAVGDLIAGLNMRYGSPESIEFVEELYKQFALASYRTSVQLAKERGSFPAFDYDLEKDHPFIKRIMAEDPELLSEYKVYGRRNIANLTTPPAGSTSMLAKSFFNFGTTSGIENVLFIKSVRRKKINPNDLEAKVDFVDDQGIKWTEYNVYHEGFDAWKKISGFSDEDIDKSPYWKSTADDVDWVAKVDMQAAAQKWIDHSISNTTNVPEDISVETTGEIYMRGWESNCKGLTIYRKNSRQAVVMDESSAKKKANAPIANGDNHAVKRPAELLCDVYHSTVQGEKWTIFIGLLDGRPYEVMGGLSKYVKLPKRIRSGKIVKHNGEINPARYDFHYDYEHNLDDETIIRDIGNVFENAVNTAFTRSISLNLRHRIPVQYICEQLLKGAEKESDFFSFSKAMSRVLKNYIVDGTKASQKKCSDCKSSNLSYQQGCVTCLDCGSSKCG